MTTTTATALRLSAYIHTNQTNPSGPERDAGDGGGEPQDQGGASVGARRCYRLDLVNTTPRSHPPHIYYTRNKPLTPIPPDIHKSDGPGGVRGPQRLNLLRGQQAEAERGHGHDRPPAHRLPRRWVHAIDQPLHPHPRVSSHPSCTTTTRHDTTRHDTTEPSTGMDPVARRFMWQVISDITTKRGECCVILTTHSM